MIGACQSGLLSLMGCLAPVVIGKHLGAGNKALLEFRECESRLLKQGGNVAIERTIAGDAPPGWS